MQPPGLVGATLRIVAAVTLAGALSALAAQQLTPPQQLQEAVRLMEATGDHRAAIRLLTTLTTTSDRATAARAWLYLGMAREQLGLTEAAEAYRQVLTNFTDQPEVAAQARRRLASVEQPSAYPVADTPTIRQLEWDDFFPTGAPSPDGRWLPGISAGAVALMDLRMGARRLVTSSADAAVQGTALRTALSPRGDRVAFEWYPDVLDGAVELHLANIADGNVRVLLRDEDVTAASPVRWTPDGRSVLVALSHRDESTELVLVGDDGALRTLLRLRDGPLGLDLSPDGRFVVYDGPQGPDAAERDIMILDSSTGESRPLLPHPANDLYPTWMTSGGGLAFVSNRTGPLALWLVDVVNGVARGEPRRLLAAAGRVIPLGFTDAGAFFYRAMTGLVDVYTVDVDLATPRVGNPVKVVAGSIAGTQFFSSWAPDGRRLAFTSRRAEVHFEPGSTTMVICDLDTGRWRELTPPLSAMSVSEWSPDGRTLVVRGTGRPAPDGPRRLGLWLLDVATGGLTPFLFRPEGMLGSPSWRRDGRALLFSDGAEPTRIVEREIATGAERVIAAPAAGGFTVSHDGAFVAFIQREPASQTLIVVPTAGGERRAVATFDAEPVVALVGWDPADAEVIVMSGLSLGGRDEDPTEVWAVRARDGVKRRIGRIDLPHARSLRLSPDGTRLSFEAGVWDWSTWVMEHAVRPVR